MGILSGELARVDFSAISGRSIVALAYLSVFGSIVAFSAYGWLLRAVRPALVGTYAYVNPVVAVLLGWWLVDERLTGAMVIGSAGVIGSVILAQRGRVRAERSGAKTRAESPSTGTPAAPVEV
jgi:drug/metabolite transporter (DMT)-like permease